MATSKLRQIHFRTHLWGFQQNPANARKGLYGQNSLKFEVNFTTEECHLLECGAVRAFLRPTASYCYRCSQLADSFNLEDEGETFFRNVGFNKTNAAPYPGRLQFFIVTPGKPQILRFQIRSGSLTAY
jgi:hypothetical protein